MAKTIILKNSTGETIIVESLGLVILSGEDANIEYDEILTLERADDLQTLIASNSITVNNGTSDLSPSEAIEYLKITTDLTNYYDKDEADALLGIKSPLIHDHSDIYYGKGDVDNLIAGVEGYGIIGAVDAIEDLPSSYTGNVGDIYIVKSTSGSGSMGPQPYTVNTETALYLPMEDSLQDELGHELEVKDDAVLASSLTPPLGTQYGEFDGDKAHIKVKKASDLGQGPELTVGGWIYPRGTGSYGIIGRWGENGDGWKIDVRCNKLRGSFDTLSMNAIQFYDPNNITTNKWIHVALVYNGSNVILYKNAMPVNQVSANGIYIDSEDEYLYIGKWSKDWDGDKDYFDGGMKEMFLQNSAMNQAEIQQLVFGDLENYYDEGFYQWDGLTWNFLSHNTGENGGGTGSAYHNSLLGLNSDDYQHLTAQEKLDLIGHNHDDNYYTEDEVDSLLTNKSNTNHTHTEYQTSTQVDAKIQAINYSDISSQDSSTNITGAELETLTNGSNADSLHTHSSLGGSSGSGGLDEAYDNNSQWSQGTGRQINVDFGAVQINASGGYAPLKITPIDYTPSLWLGGGELCVYDSELFLYDSVRGKWLSINSISWGGGYNSNNVKNSYLKGFNGTSHNSMTGWVAPWNGTITTLSISSDSTGCSNNIIVMNGGSATDATVYYAQNSSAYLSNFNVNFSAGDVLSLYMNGNDNDADRPQAWVIVKRRI